MVKKSEEYGERRSKLWRLIGTESPFKNQHQLFSSVKTFSSEKVKRIFNKGCDYYREKKYYLAEEAYKDAITLQPSKETFNNYGILLDRLKRYREADENFRRGLSLDVSSPKILENYVDFLVHVDLMDKAEKITERWVQAHSTDPKAWLKYAFILTYQGKFRAAEEKFKNYKEVSSKKNTFLYDKLLKDQAKLKFALRLAFLGSERATKYVDHPELGDYPFQTYATIMALLGRYDEAEQIFVNTLEKERMNPNLSLAYSSILQNQGRINKLEEVLNDLSFDFPQKGTTNSQLANLFLLVGQDEKAQKLHKKALEQSPNNALVQFSYAQFLVRREEEKANQHFLHALEIAPRSPEIHSGYGNYLIGEGRENVALQHLERAVHLNPQDSLIHLSLARIHKVRGQWKKAQQHKRKAYRLNAEAVKDHLRF